jgi:hypothetical protein
VARVSPAHDATNIAAAFPIVIQFSQPMDPGSVEAAFSLTPPLRGAFSWSSNRETVQFTPGGPGFPPQTLVTVAIAETARAAQTGRPLYGGFESRFQTTGL